MTTFSHAFPTSKETDLPTTGYDDPEPSPPLPGLIDESTVCSLPDPSSPTFYRPEPNKVRQPIITEWAVHQPFITGVPSQHQHVTTNPVTFTTTPTHYIESQTNIKPEPNHPNQTCMEHLNPYGTSLPTADNPSILRV